MLVLLSIAACEHESMSTEAESLDSLGIIDCIGPTASHPGLPARGSAQKEVGAGITDKICYEYSAVKIPTSLTCYSIPFYLAERPFWACASNENCGNTVFDAAQISTFSTNSLNNQLCVTFTNNGDIQSRASIVVRF